MQGEPENVRAMLDPKLTQVGRKIFPPGGTSSTKKYYFRNMEHKPLLEHGSFYHVYNRSVGDEALFKANEDYQRFLDLIPTYLGSVFDVLSYALMYNHFHLVMRVKHDEEIGYLNPKNANAMDPLIKWKTCTTVESVDAANSIKPTPEKMFGHLLNAYAKWFNYKYGRNGRLFDARFERKKVNNEDQLRQLICYVNRNPEHHHIVRRFRDYRWTSFDSIINDVPGCIDRSFVCQLFQDVSVFQAAIDRVDFDVWVKDEK